MRRAFVLLFVASCAASTGGVNEPRPGPRSSRCEEQYAQIEKNWASYMPREEATSPFRHCPHWREAMPDPGHCMCDLCDRDSDCGPGASCVTMSSVICGGYDERVCIRADDPCHPSNAAKTCPTHCVTLFGKPKCVSREDARMCGR